MNEWKSESIDREAMVRLVDERIAALRAAALETVDSAIAVHETLEPEQRETISRMIERRMKHRGR